MKLVSRRFLMPIFAAMVGLTFSAGVALAEDASFSGTIDGDVEVNTDYATFVKDGGSGDDYTETQYGQGGRARLNFIAKKEMGGMFAEGKGRLEINQGGTVGGSDMYVTVGTSTFDVQAGYFESWGLYAKGNDVLMVSAPDSPDIYEANYSRGRGPGGIALHVTPGGPAKFEMRLHYGADTITGLVTVDDEVKSVDYEANVVGFRPAVDLTFGSIGVVGVYETYSKSSQDDDEESSINKSGYGLKLTGSFGKVDFGVNLTSGSETGETHNKTTDVKTDNNDMTTGSIGGYVNFGVGDGSIGLALHNTTETTEYETKGKDDLVKTHTQSFIVYDRSLPVDGTSLKLAYAMATGNIDAGDGADDLTNTASGFRARLVYTY